MAWPRIKKSRSSALPETREHNGVHVTVAPAPDADPAKKRGQNTGVSGTRHSVSNDQPPPVQNEQPSPVQYADSGKDDVSADVDRSTRVPDDTRPKDDGIAILEGVVTTVVPADDEEPATGREAPRAQRNQQIATPRPATAVLDAKRAAPDEPPVSTTPPAWDSQQRLSVRDLPPDVRIRLWRWRAILVIIVGVLFTIVANWEVGLTLAILAGIGDTIYRSRTAADIARGGSQSSAQRRTRRQLHRMRRAGYLVLDARPIPNSREVIDHLVIGPTGAYAIDSERWHKKVPIRTYNSNQLWHGPENKKARLEHAKWEARQASDRLTAAVGFEVPVRAAMAIYGPKIPWGIATIRDVDVFTGTDLGKYLRRRGRKRDLPRLSKEQVEKVYKAAMTALPDVAPTRSFTPVG
jgi:Nuclease-related domain